MNLTIAVLKLPGRLPGQLDMFILSSKYGARLKMPAMFEIFNDVNDCVRNCVNGENYLFFFTHKPLNKREIRFELFQSF